MVNKHSLAMQEPGEAKEDLSSVPDPSLDFISPAFDALKALQTDPSCIQLPYPAVQPCDNLDAYHSVVTGTRIKPPAEKHVAGGNAGVDTQEGIRKNMVAGPLPERLIGGSSKVQSREGKGRGFVSVLDYMQKSDLGPLELLKQCRHDGVNVRVWIRHCVGVRGVCDGVPIAFDHHMNVVLCDVIEQYVPFRTVANGGVVERKRRKKKKSKKNPLTSEEAVKSEKPSEQAIVSISNSCSHLMPQAVTRHLKQVFIRGDNIIMINRPSKVT